MNIIAKVKKPVHNGDCVKYLLLLLLLLHWYHYHYTDFCLTSHFFRNQSTSHQFPQKWTFGNGWSRSFYRRDALPLTQPTAPMQWSYWSRSSSQRDIYLTNLGLTCRCCKHGWDVEMFQWRCAETSQATVHYDGQTADAENCLSLCCVREKSQTTLTMAPIPPAAAAGVSQSWSSQNS